MKMSGGKALAATVVVTAVAGILGYICATAYFTFRDYGFTAAVDWAWLARSNFPLRAVRPDDFWLATSIIGGFCLVGLFGAALLIYQRRAGYD